MLNEKFVYHSLINYLLSDVRLVNSLSHYCKITKRALQRKSPSSGGSYSLSVENSLFAIFSRYKHPIFARLTQL